MAQKEWKKTFIMRIDEQPHFILCMMVLEWSNNYWVLFQRSLRLEKLRLNGYPWLFAKQNNKMILAILKKSWSYIFKALADKAYLIGIMLKSPKSYCLISDTKSISFLPHRS